MTIVHQVEGGPAVAEGAGFQHQIEGGPLVVETGTGSPTAQVANRYYMAC